jgi:hypothetical protein
MRLRLGHLATSRSIAIGYLRLHSGYSSMTQIFMCGITLGRHSIEHQSTGFSRLYSSHWQNSDSLTYRVAVSEDTPEGTRRIYVQDTIRQDAKRIWLLVFDGGCVGVYIWVRTLC